MESYNLRVSADIRKYPKAPNNTVSQKHQRKEA